MVKHVQSQKVGFDGVRVAFEVEILEFRLLRQYTLHRYFIGMASPMEVFELKGAPIEDFSGGVARERTEVEDFKIDHGA